MSQQLIAAQVGCGAFAMAQHGPNATRNANVGRFKWACDVSEASAAAFAETFGAEKTTTDFRDAVTDPEVDIVLIATSHEVHVPIIEAAAAAGKHIFCEKPMAMDESEAYAIIRAVRQGGVKLCVDYMRRCAPAVVALKREWLAHRANPKHQPWRYIERPREKFIEETSTDLTIRIQDESSSYRTVHLDPVRGGGTIIGEGVHWLDMACWLFDDDRPVQVQAWGSARMRWGIHLAFQSGNAATILMTPNGTFDYPKEMFEIACDGALFRSEHFVENQYLGRPGIDRELFELSQDPLPNVGAAGGLAGFIQKHRALCKGMSNLKTAWTSLAVDKGHRSLFDAFVDAVLSDTPAPCDELAGYHATLLGDLARRSIELNRPLPVPAEKWDYYVEL